MALGAILIGVEMTYDMEWAVWVLGVLAVIGNISLARWYGYTSKDLPWSKDYGD